ncbi:hexosaminidase D-like [Centruroides vittatus]|uniref:hexosaminidase D-like n=1 Tax=Centruroides vittatus TaxID=120091 RepID=UPI003510B718
MIGINMLAKFRFYILLVGSSAIIFLVLYKTLNGEQDVESTNKVNKVQTPKKLRPMENINDLMPVTQPHYHMEHQKLREAEVHARINQNIRRSTQLKRDNLNFANKIESFKSLTNGERNQPDTSFLLHKIVHLDLKGAPPTINYYSQLFPLLHSLGATGLLIEYEDMLPYWEPIETLSAHNAYSKNQIEQLLRLAQLNKLEVIPLIQTFGHMEFVLKQIKYQQLREVPLYPQVICPSQNNSKILLTHMIDQIISLHPGIKWLHIGCDEVYYIGQCDLCQHRMTTKQMNSDLLFLEHVKFVAQYVKSKHNVQPIMWDDMFRHVSSDIIQASEIWKYVEIMVWQYGPNIEAKLTQEIWEKYQLMFSGIWVASAFKGATGPNQFLTNISYHLENHHSWMNFLQTFHKKIPLRGIILTGWQRYDHFAVLCELLAAAIPSLAADLLYLKDGFLDQNKLHDILHCNGDLILSGNYTFDEVICNYPGGKVFKGMQRLQQLKHQIMKMMKDNHVVGWMSDYNIQMSFSSPAHVELGMRKLGEIQTNATLLYTFMQNIMPEVYDKYTIDEWLQTYMDPIMLQLENLSNTAQKLLKYSAWPRRPLNSNE